MSEARLRWQARIGSLKAWALLIGLFVAIGIWSLILKLQTSLLNLAKPPSMQIGLILAIAGLSLLLLLCVSTFFFPNTVFHPHPVEPTDAPASTVFVTKATGRLRELRELEPAIEVGRGTRRFREAIAHLVPLEGQRLMVYVHFIEGQGISYGIDLWKSKRNWAAFLDPAHTLSVEPGKLLGWHDRCAIQVQYDDDRGKPQTLLLTFDDARAQYTVLSALRQMGFAVSAGSATPAQAGRSEAIEDRAARDQERRPTAPTAHRPERDAPPTSLRGRAILAVLLTIGFYGLALAVVAFLLSLVYVQVVFLENVNVRLVVTCVVTAALILWSILPRFDRFIPPGPRLTSEGHPALFREIGDVANRLEQKPPDEVYLVPQMNAFVAERGGWLGIGRRRMVGIGLPLLQTLTVAQLRGVIAHEFGHFDGGDTRLAPWIYRTRQAIARTVQSMGDKSWLYLLFRWYGKLFLRVTHSISRHQEFLADRLAAQWVGSRPFVEGLQRIHGVAPAFQSFLAYEVAPVVQAGYRPSLEEGFGLFLSQPSVATAIQSAVEQVAAASETSPYDTHPSPKERIEAVQSLPPGASSMDDAEALSLLAGVSKLEAELFAGLVGTERAAELAPIEWQSAATKVWLPYWTESVRHYAAGLEGLTAGGLPSVLQSPDKLEALIQQSAGRLLSDDERRTDATRITAMALAVALVGQGWTLETSPGAPISLQKGEIRIEPFAVVPQLEAGELDADAWQAQCRQAGIAGLRLGTTGDAE